MYQNLSNSIYSFNNILKYFIKGVLGEELSNFRYVNFHESERKFVATKIEYAYNPIKLKI